MPAGRSLGGSRPTHAIPDAQDRARPLRRHPRRRAADHPGRLDPRSRAPRVSRVGKAAELADAPADRTIDARRPARDPRLRERPHAHQLRPRRARHLPGRRGQPAALRLPAPDGDDGGGGVPHDVARPGRAPQGRHRRLRRSREHQVPGRVPPGVRGRGHPRDPRRVRGGPGGPVPAAPVRVPTRRSPARRPSSGSGTAASTGGSGRGRCRSRRRPAAPTSWAGSSALADEHGTGLTLHHRKRRRRAAGVPRPVTGSARPSTSNRTGPARAERAPVPRAGPRRRPRSSASRAPARRWRCARS